MGCCGPVFSGCLSWCDGNTAINCEMATDANGCPVAEMSTIDCGADPVFPGQICQVSDLSGLAQCVDLCAPQDAVHGPDTCNGGVAYRWDGTACEYFGDTCACIGADCSYLSETLEACVAAHKDCPVPPAVDARELCDTTGGTWDDDTETCDCPPTASGEKVWDPEEGCLDG